MASIKLHIPPIRSSLVFRPKLMSKLDEGMKAKLTVVSAQAGYGKTTALSGWAKLCSSPVAWVSLDVHDNDWIAFWSYVTASIQARIAGFAPFLRALIEKGPSVSAEPAMSMLLNELAGLDSELSIILDDFQFIELPSIQHSFIYLLEHLPAHIHIYIASRNELPIPTARLRAKGEFHQIKMPDLRFELEEGFVFFRDLTELHLTKEQVTRLCLQTEGWISGLQLAAISLKQSGNIPESIEQFNGHHHHISDYLLEEVFSQLPIQLRDFLLETSILQRLNASICEAVTGCANSQEQLEKIERLNLFIIPLDEQRGWYRYHHLLSDFLQQQLLREKPDKKLQAHIRAAQWLESQGLEQGAVEHFLQGQQYSDAVRLMEKNLIAFMQTKSVVLNRWLSVLPESTFADKPMVEMFYISVLLGVGEWKAAFRKIEQARIRFASLKEQLAEADWKRAMGNIYFFCSIVSYLHKDLKLTSEYLEQMEQYMPEGSFFQTMGRNRYQGYDAFDDHLAFINDLHAASAFLLRWIKAWEHKKQYPFIGFLNVSYSKLLYEWNQLDDASFYANQALGRDDIKPFARIMIQLAVSASQIEQAKGNSERAAELLMQLKSHIDSPDAVLFHLRIEAEQARLALRQGFIQEAQNWLYHCGMLHTDEVSLGRVPEHLIMARVLAACGRPDDALHLLGRLLQLLSAEDRLRDRIKSMILQSLIFEQVGRMDAALAQLEGALRLAEPQGYIRSFIDEGERMAVLLIAYTKTRHAIKNAKEQRLPVVTLEYVRELLLALNAEAGEKQQVKIILTEQEIRVLRLIADGLENKEIAAKLGNASETIKWHIKSIYRKLGVSNRVQALQVARESNIFLP
ncbi:LuxR C-terminal-related transcriptional regulator [Paenibacillus algorifonticola]|uniref:LuxR C-terminal-related transcriptional regulator n=1 Tax=Paenibacillus algorifonticola TaxID=684063 RepID=UPI003D2AC708